MLLPTLPHHQIAVWVFGAVFMLCPQSCPRAASGTALETPMRELFPWLLAIVLVQSSALSGWGVTAGVGESWAST